MSIHKKMILIHSLIIATFVGITLMYNFYDYREVAVWRFAWSKVPIVLDTRGNVVQPNIEYPKLGPEFSLLWSPPWHGIEGRLEEMLMLPYRGRMMAEFAEKWSRYQWKDEEIIAAFTAISSEIDRLPIPIVTIKVKASRKDIAMHVLEEVRSRLVREVELSNKSYIDKSMAYIEGDRSVLDSKRKELESSCYKIYPLD